MELDLMLFIGAKLQGFQPRFKLFPNDSIYIRSTAFAAVGEKM
jgi:hypothetical protein